MLRKLAERGVFVRVLGVLAVALLCVVGALQAAHAHPGNSAASHHRCTICVAAQAGADDRPSVSAPILVAVSEAALPGIKSQIVRPGSTVFIRPPPSF